MKANRKQIAFDGEKLRELRIKCGYRNQKDAAAALHISSQALSRAECGYGLQRRTADAIIRGYRDRLQEMESEPSRFARIRQDLESLASDPVESL